MDWRPRPESGSRLEAPAGRERSTLPRMWRPGTEGVLGSAASIATWTARSSSSRKTSWVSPEEREEMSGLTPLERGTLVHELFERFYRAWQAQGDATITPSTLPEGRGVVRQAHTRRARAPAGGGSGAGRNASPGIDRRARSCRAGLRARVRRRRTRRRSAARIRSARAVRSRSCWA